MTNNLSPKCWKNCGEIAIYMHTWWSCHYISIFWKHVIAKIKLFTGVLVPLKPEILLFNVWDEHDTAFPHKDLISLLLALARLSIAHWWKCPSLPSISLWNAKVVDLLIMHKFTNRTSQLSKNVEGYTDYEILWYPVISNILANPAIWGISKTLLDVIVYWKLYGWLGYNFCSISWYFCILLYAGWPCCFSFCSCICDLMIKLRFFFF